MMSEKLNAKQWEEQIQEIVSANHMAAKARFQTVETCTNGEQEQPKSTRSKPWSWTAQYIALIAFAGVIAAGMLVAAGEPAKILIPPALAFCLVWVLGRKD